MRYLTLETLLARGENSISPRALYLLQHPLVEELIAMRDSDNLSGTLNESSVELSEDFKKVRVTSANSSESLNIESYGALLKKAIGHSKSKSKRLAEIAEQCCNGKIDSFEQVHLLLERMVSSTIYKIIIVIILAGLAIMASIQHFWTN